MGSSEGTSRPNGEPRPSDTRRAILDEIDRHAQTLKAIALEIHANPELGFEEHRAAKLWSDLLEQEGFDVERGIAGLDTAFQATTGSGNVTAALMVEYDALPDLGHACGHHVSGAASCGAALGLRAVIGQLDGRVIAFGSPAEEGLSGKCYIVEAGFLEGVDFAMMSHARDRNIGAMSHTATAKFRVKYHGKSAHAAAAPEHAINALDAMIQLFNGINAMRQQVRDNARIHGVILKGGSVPNIIPDYSEATFYIRDFEDYYLQELVRKFMDIVEGAALQTGARAEVEDYGRSTKSNIPNPILDGAYRQNAAELGVVIDEEEDTFSRGSTDMGDVSHVVPSIHPTFQAAPRGTPVHSWAFTDASKDEAALDSMVTTAKILALTAYDLIVDRKTRDQMAHAHRERFEKHVDHEDHEGHEGKR
jgi:amidohydrolase